MKHLLSAIVFPAMFISISNVYALDIQPGEWKMESMVTPVFATPILTTSWLA